MTEFILFIGGIAAGVINAVAGGGSTIVLPLLMLMGIDAATANGTNRVAVLFQSTSATRTFARRGHLERGIVQKTLPLVVLGAICGALAAANVPVPALEKTFSLCFFGLGIWLIFPKRSSTSRAATTNRTLANLIYILIGFYGGFIQAGVGIPLLLALLGCEQLNFAQANATKVFCILVYSCLAITVFGSMAQIDWVKGIILGIGGLVGGDLGARFATSKTPKYLHPALGLFLLATAVKFLVG